MKCLLFAFRQTFLFVSLEILRLSYVIYDTHLRNIPYRPNKGYIFKAPFVTFM